MIKSVPEYVEERYGSTLLLGKKSQCPKCQHKTVSLKKDESLAKCFHPDCGWYITHSQVNYITSDIFGLTHVLQRYFEESHEYLLSLEKDSTSFNAYRYLAEERSVHPQVIKDSMIGAVTPHSKLNSFFEEAVEEIVSQMENLRKITQHKAGPKKGLDKLQNQLQILAEQKEKLIKTLTAKAGWLCFFYTTQYHNIVSVKLRKPYSKEIRVFKPFKNAGVFNHHLFSATERIEIAKDLHDLLVFEGDFNSLQLQSLAAHLGMGYASCCSVGGILSTDWETLKNFKRTITFCYDNDLNKAGFELVTRAREYFTIYAFSTPKIDSDADSFIKEFGSNYKTAHEGFKALLKQRKKYPRNYGSIQDEIEAIRLKEGGKGGLKQFQVHKEVSELAISDLKERGELFQDNNTFTYYFHSEDKTLVRVEEHSKELRLTFDNYELNVKDKIYHFTTEKLRIRAWNEGEKVNIYKFAHYDKNLNILYIFNNRNQIYKITPDDITLVDNGTDGVLFAYNRNASTFKLEDIEDDRDYLFEYLIKPLQFDSHYITPEEYQALLSVWTRLLFFESISPTKPIAAFIGPKGSGKSSFLRGLGQILFGNKFNVSPVSREERDFDATVVNNYLVCIDNADSYKPWINDKLSCIATGQRLQYRPLFKDITELLDIEPHCFVGVTSRTPPYTRDDVVDRMLVFKMSRLDKGFRSESSLQKNIAKNRNKIITSLIKDLQRILRKLSEPWDENELFPFRMADFASFCLRIHDRDIMEPILCKLNKEQALLVTENEPLLQVIHAWLERGHGEMSLSAGELCEELKKIAKSCEIKFDHSPHSLGLALSSLKKELRDQDIIIEETRSKGKKRYRFRQMF